MPSARSESQIAELTKEYPPSWVDRFSGLVNRLPGPAWVYYLSLAAGILLIQVICLALDGILLEQGLNLAHIFIALAIAYILGLINYLDQFAVNRLEILRMDLNVDDDQFRRLSRNISTMPLVTAILAGLIGLLSMFAIESISRSPYILEALEGYSVSEYAFRIMYMILWWVFGTLIYHTIHQLRLIRNISEQLIEINLYQPKSLYTFSNMIAITAFCTALLPIGFLLANPGASWNDPAVFITVLIVQLIALGTFIWPHYGIHRQQVAEKQILLDQTNKRIEAVGRQLHNAVDNEELQGIGEMNTALSTLNLELSIIERIPTWPWQPETLRILITALALPLGLWLVQVLLGRFLGS